MLRLNLLLSFVLYFSSLCVADRELLELRKRDPASSGTLSSSASAAATPAVALLSAIAGAASLASVASVSSASANTKSTRSNGVTSSGGAAPLPLITTSFTISTDKTSTVEGVTKNTAKSTTDKNGHNTVVPIFWGCWFCGGGAVVAWGLGTAPGVYPPPPNPPIPNFPTVTIGRDGQPTPDPSKSDDKNSASKTKSDESRTSTSTSKSSSSSAYCSVKSVTNAIVSCPASAGSSASCSTKTTVVSGSCSQKPVTSTTHGSCPKYTPSPDEQKYLGDDGEDFPSPILPPAESKAVSLTTNQILSGSAKSTSGSVTKSSSGSSGTITSSAARSTTSCVYDGGGPDGSPHCVCGTLDKAPLTGSFTDFHSSCVFPLTALPTGVFSDPVVASNNAAEASSISVAAASQRSVSSVSAASASKASAAAASKASAAAANATPTCQCTRHDPGTLAYGFYVEDIPKGEFDGDIIKSALDDHCEANINDFSTDSHGCDDSTGLCSLTFEVAYSPSGCVEDAFADAGVKNMQHCYNTY